MPQIELTAAHMNVLRTLRVINTDHRARKFKGNERIAARSLHRQGLITIAFDWDQHDAIFVITDEGVDRLDRDRRDRLTPIA